MNKDLSYIEMYEKFYKSYYSLIKPFLEILEKERKIELKKHIGIIVIFIVSVLVALALIALIQMNDTCSLWGHVLSHCFKLPNLVRFLIILITCAIGIISYVAMQSMLHIHNNFNYCTSLKFRLMPLVIDCLGCIKYEQKGVFNLVTKEDLLKYRYIDKCIFNSDIIMGGDVFKGYRNGVKFEIIECQENVIYIGFELNKKLNEEVFIKPKKNSVNRMFNITVLDTGIKLLPIGLLLIPVFCIQNKLTISISLIIGGYFIWKLLNNLVVSKRRTLDLEDLNFNDKFLIYSDDEVEARYFATTAFIDRLVNLELAFKASDIMCLGFEDKLIFLIYKKKNLFELGSLYKQVDTTKYIEEVFNQIAAIMLMIDHFKLDEKTGL